MLPKNSLYELSHPCQLTLCIILGQRGVILPDTDM